MKNRLLGLLVFLASAGMFYYNWHLLINDGYFYPKMSGISPLGMLAGLFMIVAPSLPTAQPATPGTPAAARRAAVAVIAIFGGLIFGIALGFVNLHFMGNYAP
jgi:hypothetical protein